VKAALYHFRRNTPSGGVVVMTGSITSYVPSHEGVYVYGACKYGVNPMDERSLNVGVGDAPKYVATLSEIQFSNQYGGTLSHG